MVPEEEGSGNDTKRVLVTEFKKMDKKELKRLAQLGSASPPKSLAAAEDTYSKALDCSFISKADRLDSHGRNRNKDPNINQSAFVICTNDELLKEEVMAAKKELHKERQRNAELWSVLRKAQEALKATENEFETVKGKAKKEEAAKGSAKGYLEKQKAELVECEKTYQNLREDTVRISRERTKTDEKVKAVTQLNTIYQNMIKRMLETSQTKKAAVNAMKALGLLAGKYTKKDG